MRLAGPTHWATLMTEIPSHIASSAAQAGYQARDVGRERDARRAGQTNTAQRQVKAVEDASETVDTTDFDTRVTSDSEGAGSQGRAFDEDADTDDASTNGESPPGLTKGEDGQMHLDLEA